MRFRAKIGVGRVCLLGFNQRDLGAVMRWLITGLALAALAWAFAVAHETDAAAPTVRADRRAVFSPAELQVERVHPTGFRVTNFPASMLGHASPDGGLRLVLWEVRGPEEEVAISDPAGNQVPCRVGTQIELGSRVTTFDATSILVKAYIARSGKWHQLYPGREIRPTSDVLLDEHTLRGLSFSPDPIHGPPSETPLDFGDRGA